MVNTNQVIQFIEGILKYYSEEFLRVFDDKSSFNYTVDGYAYCSNINGRNIFLKEEGGRLFIGGSLMYAKFGKRETTVWEFANGFSPIEKKQIGGYIATNLGAGELYENFLKARLA